METRRTRRAINANDRTQEGDNNITVTTASDNEATSQACSSRRRGRKLTKTETRPRQQWDRTMEKVLVKIMCTEKAKGKGFMARAKQQWDIQMPEYDFFNMKNLRDKFAKIDQDKVEELLQEKDQEHDADERANSSSETEEMRELECPIREEHQDQVFENDEELEISMEDLSDYEKNLLEKAEELVKESIDDRKSGKIKTSPRKEVLQEINQGVKRVWFVLKSRLSGVEDVWKLNCLVFAVHLLYANTAKEESKRDGKNKEDEKLKEIKALRRWISWIDNDVRRKIERRQPTKRQMRNSRMLIKKYGRRSINGWRTQKLRLIERLRILVTRRKRQQKQFKRQRQNALYQQSPQKWYNDLNTEDSKQKEANISNEDVERILTFWSHMWDDQDWNKRNEWKKWLDYVKNEIKQTECNVDINENVTMLDLKGVLKKASPMKAAGPDCIPMYWWKNLKTLHPVILKVINNEIKDESNANWLYEGHTWLFTKKGKEEKDERGKRPITCLNTFYKIVSALVATKLGEFVKKAKLYPIEQRGGMGGNMGCREQVIVDDAIHAEVKQHKRDLAEAWIDLRKAYDSIYKKWLIEGLKLLGVPNWIVEFVKRASEKWCTTIMIKVKGKTMKSDKIRIRRGIFQGDSLSPLLFCVCIIPVTLMLRKMKLGYMFGPARKRTLQKMITNLLFMDDMKIYAVLISNLRKMLDKAADMFQTIGLELGEEKCEIQQFKHGKKVEEGEQMELQVGKTLSYLGVGNSYPYLGFLQEEGIMHKKIKEELRREFKKKCKVVWKSELNARNKVQAYNELVVAKLTYTFGVVKWTRQELEDLDVTGRKIMNIARCLHPRSAIERLYISRDEGGRGLLNVTEMHDRISVGLAMYICNSDSKFMESVKEHELAKWSGTRLKDCVTILERYGIEATIMEGGSILVNGENMKAKKVCDLIRKTAKANRIEALRRKAVHGQFWKFIENENASNQSWLWVKDGKIDGSVEATVMAIQDGVLWTRNYQKVIGIVDIVDKCRLCGEPKENLGHLLASCKVLLGAAIKERHDDCARAIYVKACWELGLLKEQLRWWEKQKVERVLENDEWLVLWDHTFATDRTLEFTRPDIVFENKRTMEGVIVELGICLEQNIQKKLSEKREKYVKLAMEVSKLRRWQKWKIVPVVISVTGIVTRTWDELKNIPGIGERQERELIKEMQKIVIYKAVNIMRHVLNNE